MASILNYVAVQNGNHEVSVLDELLPTVRPPGPTPPSPPAAAPALPPAPTPGPTTPVARAPGKRTSLNDLIGQFTAQSGHLSAATRAKFDYHFKVAARYLDFNREAGSICLADLRELKSRLSEDRKPSTVNDILFKALGALFNMAVDDGLIERSPLERLKRARRGEPDRGELNWEQAQRVVDEVGRYATESGIIASLMKNFGVGQAEIQHLRGEDIARDQALIHFRRKKTGKPFDVPIFPHAKSFVEKLQAEGRIQVGKPLVTWRNPRKALESACERLNLPKCEPRAFRRSFIVHCLENGIDPRLVARWQGHKDATLILKVYGKHIDPEHEKRQAERLGDSAGSTAPKETSAAPVPPAR